MSTVENLVLHIAREVNPLKEPNLEMIQKVLGLLDFGNFVEKLVEKSEEEQDEFVPEYLDEVIPEDERYKDQEFQEYLTIVLTTALLCVKASLEMEDELSEDSEILEILEEDELSE